MLIVPVAVRAQFTYTTNADDTLTITGYTGPSAAVTIPTNIDGLVVTSIGSGAFEQGSGHINPTSVTIPDSITSIGQFSFAFGTNLTSATIGNGVTNIGMAAFYGSINLANITIPASVIRIGLQAFENCFGLPAITVDPQNSFYSSVNGVLFDKSQLALLEYPAGAAPSIYVIPQGVASIGLGAFADSSVTNITIPDSVERISNGAFAGASLTSLKIPGTVTNIGFGAFTDCTNLARLYFTGNAPAFAQNVFVDPVFPVYYNATIYYLPGTSGWSAPIEGVPTVLWNPLIQGNGPLFGVANDQFGFNIIGTNDFTVVVEAGTNLANPVWLRLQAVTLSNGSFYFRDPEWTNFPSRFYGLGLP